ncbi:Major capsid protein [Cupriavidus oxalaticus]|uniref:phage capsid family protein n=1 Tax=Cupriavidus oxalaticus TaxID=96344 RepID=UPI003F737886
MADTTARAGLTPQQWDDQFFMEYVRESRFKRYMGTNENSIIHIKEDLTRKPGDKVTFANVRKLRGTGVTGNQVLEGNEEELDSRSMAVTVDVRRNAVMVTDWDEQKSAIDLRNAGKTALKLWEMEKLRDDTIAALYSINGVLYAAASEGQKDAWLTDNNDRVLFGAAKGNTVAGDHSASLLNIDNTADKLTTGMVSLAKRMAMTASPAIKPIRLREDEEWYVMFAGSQAFRDLSQDSAMQQANRDARPRDVMDNPLFTGGSLIWDGVIIREIPEIPVLTGVGAGGIDVSANFLVGAQAIGVAWAQRPRTRTDVRDYGFRNGVAIQEIIGVQKLLFGKGAGDTDDLVQHGLVTAYSAAVADA